MIIRALLAGLLLLSLDLQAAHHFFVVDGSGSMSGTPMAKAKDAMQKLGRVLLGKGDQIAVIVASGPCSPPPRTVTDFVATEKELGEIISQIQTSGGNSIATGFEYAERHMEDKGLTGHIYMFGDGDGLEECKGIKNIAENQRQRSALTPFTYVGTEWSPEESKNWSTTLAELGASSVAFEAFDYNEIANPHAVAKQYFVDVKYANRDGSANDGKNYPDRPWQCVHSDGLHWFSLNKAEQKLDFYFTGPKHRSLEKGCAIGCLISEFVDQLNRERVCGQGDWRLPDFFELSRLTQLGKLRRESMFPYTRVWPHISSTKGQFTGYRRGVNLDSGGAYDYREDRPYAAIFVSGSIDKTLFEVPEAVIKRSRVRPVNPEPPVANADHYEVVQGSMRKLDVLDNDIDPSRRGIEIVRLNAPSGAVSRKKGHLIYRYLSSVTGTTTDSFSYTVRDKEGRESTAKVAVTVKAVAAPPPEAAAPQTTSPPTPTTDRSLRSGNSSSGSSTLKNRLMFGR